MIDKEVNNLSITGQVPVCRLCQSPTLLMIIYLRLTVKYYIYLHFMMTKNEFSNTVRDYTKPTNVPTIHYLHLIT